MDRLNANNSSKQYRRGGFAHELIRDWRRWSNSERIAASCILAILVVGVPAFLATLAG